MIKLTPPPPLPHPSTLSSHSLSLHLHLFHIHPSVLSFASISPSLSLCFICVSVLSFPSLHLCLFYIHLSIEPPSLLPSFSLSLTEREIININVSLFFSPSLSSLFHFFYLSFTTDLFSAPLFIPLSGSLSLIIAFTQPSLHLSPSLSLFFLSLFSALCSCSVFIYYCSVDNSLLCLQPYSHLSD